MANIRVWNASARYGEYTTGVGKHAIAMVLGLAAKPDARVEFVVPRDDWTEDQTQGAKGPLRHISVRRHILGRRTAEIAGLIAGRPYLDAPDTDWVYAPRERYAPVKKASTIVTVHDVYAFEPAFTLQQRPSALARANLQIALRRADIVAVVSAFSAERVCALFGAPSGKLVVIGNGVEDHLFGPPVSRVGEVCPALNGVEYVLSVGGVTHKKGATHLLALAGALAKAAPALKIAITGPVDAAFADEVGRQTNLCLLGRGYSNDFMHALLADARAVIVLSEYEGFAIPALEAMAVGAPLVAARRTALPETVDDAGILVEPTDTRACCEATLSVLQDTGLRESLIAKGRRRAEAFRWSKCVDRLHVAMIGTGADAGPVRQPMPAPSA